MGSLRWMPTNAPHAGMMPNRARRVHARRFSLDPMADGCFCACLFFLFLNLKGSPHSQRTASSLGQQLALAGPGGEKGVFLWHGILFEESNDMQPTTVEGVTAALKQHGPAQGAQQLLRREQEAAEAAAATGMYTVFRCEGSIEHPDFCTRVAPTALCFCGHTLQDHSHRRGVPGRQCSAGGCQCKGFRYIPFRPEEVGEWWLPRRKVCHQSCPTLRSVHVLLTDNRIMPPENRASMSGTGRRDVVASAAAAIIERRRPFAAKNAPAAGSNRIFFALSVTDTGRTTSPSARPKMSAQREALPSEQPSSHSPTIPPRSSFFCKTREGTEARNVPSASKRAWPSCLQTVEAWVSRPRAAVRGE